MKIWVSPSSLEKAEAWQLWVCLPVAMIGVSGVAFHTGSPCIPAVPIDLLFSFRPGVLNQGWGGWPPGDNWQCLETFLVVVTWERVALLTESEMAR